jgi:hypothetical protein
MWEQIHAFFDVASAVCTAVAVVIGLYIKNELGKLKDELLDGQSDLKEAMLAHGGKCDAERAELFRTANRLEGSGGSRRGRDYFNDRST